MSLEIHSVSQVLENAPTTHDPECRPLFRGQAEDWDLIPGLFRTGHAAKNFGSWNEYEQLLIRIFEREGKSFDPKCPEIVLDQVVFAQHFGLPTRCLDWSGNPLVALFFAVKDLDPSKNAVLWMFNPTRLVFRNLDTWNDLQDLKSVSAHPIPSRFRRASAQGAWVTLHPVPQNTADFQPFLSSEAERSIFRAEKWHVAGHKKFDLLCELSDLGLTKTFLYGDLDGLSGDIVWRIHRLKETRGDLTGYQSGPRTSLYDIRRGSSLPS